MLGVGDTKCGIYKPKLGIYTPRVMGERYVGSLFRVDEPVPDDSNLKTFIT